jgi:hypothetical protein
MLTHDSFRVVNGYYHQPIEPWEAQMRFGKNKNHSDQSLLAICLLMLLKLQ